ncbi:ABC transporter permease [Peptostreptococcus canis]|uniref:ABC transporter permease n=1 Tax=Peptostreptococcus canis TaxID=1159213 RepID=A0ABR6TK57_9FIRM|nr:ABC-2 family transporter protein [Peptostreptococcus canis]MBC2575574.1 ABC transporter permease [Peptostreptococcus canis]MBP1997227.1 ABC-2 type transport system permease protein [Peptostreptococcus canis]
MRKYFEIFKMALSNQLEYRVNFISSFLFSLIPFGVNTLLWLAVTIKNNDVLLGVNGTISYYFVTLVVSNITYTSSVFKISDDIRLGELSKYIIKPYNYALYQLMIDMPQRIIFITMNAVPILIIYVILSKYMCFSINIVRIFMMISLLIIGYLINFFIDFSIGLYSFYFSRVSSLYTSIKVVRNIFAGIVFPLVMLPSNILSIFKILPFAYTSYIPTIFLIKDIDIEFALEQMAIGLIWLLVLIISSIKLWEKGIEKYCTFGG